MITGTAQIDITPQPGVELSGFAARIQPSVGALDPLFAKALYLSDGHENLLWIHCDLVGVDRGIVLAFRRWAREELDISEDRVMISATHTHSGPCTIKLLNAGAYDAAYVEWLQARLREAAQLALAEAAPCELLIAEGCLDLAVDRRQTESAHTDPRVATAAFRRPTGDFAAVLVNYPMHPVALGATNRHISADIPGQAALLLSQQLPGAPVVLITNGACANLNPPAENVPHSQVKSWGKQLAGVVAPLLLRAAPQTPAKLKVRSQTVPVPLDTLAAEEIESFTATALEDARSLREWGIIYRRTVETWRAARLTEAHSGDAPRFRDAEMFAVTFGDVTWLGVNAEVFSEFTEWLRRETARQVYVVGYANGAFGYLATRAAYREGGYEVAVAHLFHGCFRAKEGGLELLAQHATELLGHPGLLKQVQSR